MTEITINASSTTPNITLSNNDGSTQDIYVPSAVSTPKRRSLNGSNDMFDNQSLTLLKKQLLEQLNEKANQIQMTAELGAALVKQQAELEQRIEELNQTEGDEIPSELKNKLVDLEREAKALEEKTAKVFLNANLFSSDNDNVDNSTNSAGLPGPSATSQNDTTTVTASSRRRDMSRQKGRTKDIEFAAEIGQGLLVEVRRLQALLQEKEERIKELESDKSELERVIESLNKQLRAKEESEEQYKEVNWNLELSRQDLNSQVIGLQSQVTKSRSDYEKLERALAIATDVIEQLKDKEEVLTNNFENLKNRHEQDMANNRRHIAAVNREKNNLVKTVEELKNQLDTLMVARSLRGNKRNQDQSSGSNDNNVSNGDDKGHEDLPDSFDENYFPSEFENDRNNAHKSLMGKNLNIELETLKALNVANRMIGNLRANLQKEKSEKYELKKLLAESQEQIEIMRYETEFHDPTSINSGTSRNRRSSNLLKRLSSASNKSVRNHETLMQEGFGGGCENGIDGVDNDVSNNEDIPINKNNRPSSDMFKPRGWKPDSLNGKSRSSVRSSIMSSRIDEDIVPDGTDEEEDAKDEEVAAARAEALNNLTKSKQQSRTSQSSRISRISRQILTEDPDSIVEILSNESQSIRDSYDRDSTVLDRVSEHEDFSENKSDPVDKDGASSTSTSPTTPTKPTSASLSPSTNEIENENEKLQEKQEQEEQEEQEEQQEQEEESIVNVIKRNPKLDLDDDNDDVSSIDSFASANEPDDLDSVSKRTSINSRRESKRASSSSVASKKFSKRESNISLLLNKKPSIFIPEESVPSLPSASRISLMPKKESRDVSVQTDKIIDQLSILPSKTDSMSTINTGKFTFGNRDTIVYESNGSRNDHNNQNIDSKYETSSLRQSIQFNDNNSIISGNNDDGNRFTLDLSSPTNRAREGFDRNDKNIENNVNGDNHIQIQRLEQPQDRSLTSISIPPTVADFGQQAGSPKLQNHLFAQNSANGPKQDDNNNNKNNNDGNDVRNSHKPSSSSDSISTVSTASTSSGQRRKSDVSHAVSNPIVSPTATGTDPAIIHAITQTMIGEYLWKYTRRNFGAGISEKRHKRFFWVHPYTKTLYWSSKDPGNNEPIDPKIKSGMSYFAYIESVKQVVDHNPSPPGLHHMSLVIKTPERELKFTAQSKERHEYWFQALNYLLQRPDETMQNGAATQGQQNQFSNQQQSSSSSIPSSPGGNKNTKTNVDARDSQSDVRNLNISNNPNQNGGGNNVREVRKKSSFSKLQSMFRRDGTGAVSSSSISLPTSPVETTAGSSHHHHHHHNHNNNIDDEDYDDLENVRQCCDGKHDISKLENHKHF